MNISEEHDNKTVNHYLIPANVSTKYEIFEGFGWSEARYVALAVALGFILYMITGFFTKTETYNINDVPQQQLIGLQENERTKIDGDVVTETKDAIPKAIRLFLIIIPGAGSFIVVKRDRSTGMSLITNIKNLKEFNSKQKRYYYKHDSGLEV